MVDFNDFVQKAKDFAAKNPDTVREGITKAEDVISSKTGGQYDAQIHGVGDQVEHQLGVPSEDQAGQQNAPQQGQQPNDGRAPSN